MKYIICPYQDKDEAKALGAKFDWQSKMWFIPNGMDETKFSKWKIVDISEEESSIQDNVDTSTFFEDIYIKPNGFQRINFEKLKISNFVILDTETTSTSKDDEVVELSVLSEDGEELYHSFFEPEKEMNIFASKKNGIYTKDLKGKPKFKDEWEKIKRAIDGKTIVGHNIEFDERLIFQTLSRYNLDVLDAQKLFVNSIDSLEIAQKHIKDAPNYKLETLMRMAGINEEEHHRASYDCLHTLCVLQAIETGNIRQLTEEEINSLGIKKTTKKAPVKSKSKKESKEKTSESSKKKSRKEVLASLMPLLESKKTIDEISEILKMENKKIEYYIESLPDLTTAFYLLDAEKENTIIKAINSIQNWDFKLRPVKDILGDDFSYFEIKLTINKNNLNNQNKTIDNVIDSFADKMEHISRTNDEIDKVLERIKNTLEEWR